jgi:spore coat protein U-like protein
LHERRGLLEKPKQTLLGGTCERSALFSLLVDNDMNATKIKLSLAISAAMLAGGSMAATDTANLTVGASIANSCAIGPGVLDFGALSAFNAGLGTTTGADHDADSGATISIACTNGTAATINAGLGAHAAGAVRKMISGSDLLSYELYTSAARTTVLDATTGSISYLGTGSATTTEAVYGRVTGAQLAAAKKGTYADTVALTISYTP